MNGNGLDGLPARQGVATTDSVGDAVTFRWLGVAGVELRVAARVLLVDPFRPQFVGGQRGPFRFGPRR